ncbi:zinc finger protein basonuclin-2-like [Dreissena polymorpha]|uniref:C2H2-type domain-containing protein n=1 Tax=Dreissena polymorpha TaxID=45954 RepID=A0A9D4QRP4_DREPO|nr:zinc finger protein basonuclin-2-like [Dreissena polymorpha]XP_052280646.1 zinc finger protein basonuclin-2-like [Dreissena polymorpha]KAH3840152.1 hypothetical protein DPMN_113596 [Dreissena polymorpha]
MKPLEAIRCTTPGCSCECFLPSKPCLRSCESCKHGWVAHALDKLGYRHLFNAGLQVEIVQPNIVFDIASLMLYGAQATPIRLKILLDRLFSVLQHEEVLQVLHGFGWTYEDYARGYILQEASGRVLDKWICATRDEEFVIMQQFLRFGETKSIAQEIILQDTKERQDIFLKQTTRNDSEIKKFIERSNLSMQNLIRPFDVRQIFGARLPYLSPTGNRLPVLSPPLGFSTPTSAARDLRPPLISVSSTSPVTTSPLGRLQTMQPFDFRREAVSPSALSPGEKPSTVISPKSESPHNLSLTSTSAQSTPPHTPYTPQKHLDMDMSAHVPTMPTSLSLTAPTMMLPTLQRHGHNDDGVLNFSMKEDQDSSLYLDRKNKHLRKSSNPIKRNWIPDSTFGSSMIGPNGKKRVLCSACNKTFCDKGALKIHYSAVHLKEMHKCSVEGCTMMFSSRRSRNRHSANPNPKLHMPQKRPKIPEGARLVDDGTSHSSKRAISSPPSVLMANAMVTGSPGGLGESPKQRPFYNDPNITMPVFPTAAKRLKLEDLDDGPKDLSVSFAKRETSPGNASLNLVPDHMLEEYQHALKCGISDEQDSSDNSRSEASGSHGQPRSQSRRKNTPIRLSHQVHHYRNEDGTRKNGNEYNNHIESKKDVEDENSMAKGGAEVGSELSDDEDRGLERSDNKLVIDDDDDDDDNIDGDDEDDDDIDRTDTGEVLDFAMHMPEGMDPEQFSATSHESDEESNESTDMSKQTEHLSDFEIPLNIENPKQCVSCGKTFLNIFGLKIHYKNVHLKLMHTCTVEGCGASFPSKRSRDRHSSNLNLHRKLLSSSEEQNNSNDADDNQNFRADIIQKLYENQSLEDREADSESEGKHFVKTTEMNKYDKVEQKNIDENEDVDMKSECLTDKDNIQSESEKNGDCEESKSNNNTKFREDAKSIEKVSPNTRKTRRQLSQNDLHKNILVGDNALTV